MADGPALAVSKLTASYGPVQVLREMTWNVGAGECIALLGANGAGKTTLLRSLAGILVQRRGDASFEGRDISRLQAHQIARSGIALVPEGRHLFPTLTVQENLRAGSYLLRTQGRADEMAAAETAALTLFPRLRERLAQLTGTLSGGEQQMLAVARALVGRPRLLLLDEPTVGLAPKVVGEMFAAFARLKAEGMTIMVAEQHVPAALELADRAIVLRLGSVAIDAPAADLKGTDVLKRLYVGG